MNSYEKLLNKIKDFARLGAKVETVGASVSGLPIKSVAVGLGKTKIIVTASIHAREFITTALCLKQIEYTLAHPPNAQIYFLPCVNPDGAVLFNDGDGYFSAETAQRLRKINGSNDYSLYKANANGVDLNVNFPARWSTGKQNRFSPSSESFVGFAPLDQPESRALVRYTEKIQPHGTISYHAKGQIVYWYFHQKQAERDEIIAKRVAQKLGYALGKNYTDSAGGYKDYCIEKLSIPALTLEIIPDGYSHPLPSKALGRGEIEKNLDLPQYFAKLIEEVSNGKND